MQRGGGLISLLVIVWLVIGAVAAGQRGYYGDDRELSCKTAGDTVLTIVAGPLNYLGVNPKITCDLPEPSE
ncbi:hypothetical protein [Nocardioides sp.]|uniref:hypothetical protein n=1 Tax=Nocardioides sp. TaxID=35761 RepID=UPI000C901F21|nr:hypothetical protein [Nocardioides sp.]MAS55531.1 hypothetical protein [Pimelobacter sp.]MDE0775074.1 hypothetical protein [Nocardioides sp.]